MPGRYVYPSSGAVSGALRPFKFIYPQAPQGLPFKLGKKQVFLPNATITLCRPKKPLPPKFAHFQVPLRFNKFDLRDYLYNLYGVTCLAVRSHLVQLPPRFSETTGRLGRPPPLKYMTVEMTQPFVWPAEVDREEWHGEEVRKRAELEDRYDEARARFHNHGELRSPAHNKPSDDRTMLARQAEDLLSGKTKWENQRPLDPRWVEAGYGKTEAPAKK